MKILVISLAGIGDAFLATPLIHELRLNFPTATIDALVRWPGARDLLESNPHLNRVHHQNLIEAGSAKALKFLWPLRRERYDVSLNTYPQSKIHYRFVARLIKASQRLSHAYDNSSALDRKSTRLNSSHGSISYAVFCLKKNRPHSRRQSHCQHCQEQ